MSPIVDVQECEKCKTKFNVTVEWPFSLCEKCAKEKWISWKDVIVTEVYGLDEDDEWFAPPILPMPLKLGNFYTKKIMTKEDAARIQSHSDKTGTNQDFKARAQSAADKHKFIEKTGDNDYSLRIFYDDNFKLYLVPNQK